MGWEMTKVERIDTNGLNTMISHSLSLFQMLEESIKQYLQLAYEIISERSKDIPFNMQLYEENDSLGTLIRKFQKLTNNKQLIEDLKKVTKDRNRIVHRLWRSFFDEVSNTVTRAQHRSSEIFGQAIGNVSLRYVKELIEVSKKTTACLTSLQTEYQRLQKRKEVESKED